jgi:multiple sugar transport system permease protein
MNAALFTYFIPAAFLAVPMYKAMGTYGLLNSRWSLVLAMVTLASPYAIWVLKQASDKLPWELDEAARIDGATPLQLFRLVYLPLMLPSLVAIGTYALLSRGTSTSTRSCCSRTRTPSRSRSASATSFRPTIRRGRS